MNTMHASLTKGRCLFAQFNDFESNRFTGHVAELNFNFSSTTQRLERVSSLKSFSCEEVLLPPE